MPIFIILGIQDWHKHESLWNIEPHFKINEPFRWRGRGLRQLVERYAHPMYCINELIQDFMSEYDINHTAFAMCDAHFKGRDVHLHSSHNMMRTHNYMHHIISILRMNENQFNPPRSLFCESRTQWKIVIVRNFLAFTEKRNETNKYKRVIGV